MRTACVWGFALALAACSGPSRDRGASFDPDLAGIGQQGGGGDEGGGPVEGEGEPGGGGDDGPISVEGEGEGDPGVDPAPATAPGEGEGEGEGGHGIGGNVDGGEGEGEAVVLTDPRCDDEPWVLYCETEQPDGTKRGECEDVKTSPWHCGECGNLCGAGFDCHDGVCGERCEEGGIFCEGACVDGQADPLNCGACGVSCDPETEACKQGACAFKCEEGEEICGGRCVDMTSDAHHCGFCGRRCEIDQDCVDSDCTIQCRLPNTRCGEECVRLERNPRHCGGCDNRCDDHLVCRESQCLCEDLALTECDGACVDTLSTHEHCGECDNACPDDQACVEGECTCELEGWGVCNGRCVDLRNDPRNCGECGEVCEDDVECRYGNCGVPELLEGVQLDMPEAELLQRGWVRCWQGQFGQRGPNIRGDVLNRCNGPMLVLACRPNGNPNLSVLAMGNRADVLSEQGNNRAGRHDANGVGWYFSDSYSWGFVPAGQQVSRNSCDTGQGQGNMRMCWHTGGGQMNSGYRCGVTTLNGNNGWERLIYHVPID